jgi:precorrin-2 dehydrogenase/sirohydrochlorin ferrochelatase
MKYFPVNLDIAGRKCTVVGGGGVAARKVASLLACGGKVLVISPELTAELRELWQNERIAWCARPYRRGDLRGSFLVIAATDDELVQATVFAEAEENRQLINVADVPQRCNFILPATVQRADLTIAISTAGKSPALARQLRQKLEGMIGPEYGTLVEIMGLLRGEVLKLGRPHQENKVVFAALLHEQFAEWLKQGNWDLIKEHLRMTLGDNISAECLTTLQKVVKCQ